MVTVPSDDRELGADVVAVVNALRATLDWYGMTGSDGIPADAEAPWEPGPAWSEPRVASARSEGRRPALPAHQGDRSPLAVPPGPTTLPSHGHHPSASECSVDLPVTQASSLPPAPASLVQHPVPAGLEPGVILDEIAAEVRGCTGCTLHSTRTQTVFSRGTGISGLCFVGEGPGADEDAQGEPFVGKAGQLLDRMIMAMGFSRDEVYVCNIIKCRPPNNRKPSTEEMATCSPFLHRQLEVLSPSVIVALGATAVEGLLGITVGITRLRGSWKLYKGRIAVMPTFHPAYLLRSPSAKKEVWEDLQAVLRHMGRPLPKRK